MIKLGLTGSIGMGKSTTANMFAACGIPVHDADAVVHRLYAGRAAPLIEEAFPGTVIDGVVDRTRLSALVLGRPKAMKRLETIVHPLVQHEENIFLEMARASRHRMVLLDIPLLFETGGDKRVDASIVVTADSEIQSKRVLARPGMTKERFEAILSRQIPDVEKQRRAHFLIDTGLDLESAERSVLAVIRALSSHP